MGAINFFLFRFHSAGQGTRVVTSGIPRVKELLYMSKKIKTPSTMIFVLPDLGKKESLLCRWQHLLKEIYLEDVLVPESVEILWEPDPTQTSTENMTDQNIVRLHSIFHESILSEENEVIYPHSRWIIRAKMNKLCLVDRGLTPKDVARVLLEYFTTCSTSGKNKGKNNKT